MSTMYGAPRLLLSESGRPLPDTQDPLLAPHWAGARENKLMFQRCASCGYIRWPAGNNCPECLADGGEWTEVSGLGRLWSFCTYEHAINDAFAQDAPYVIGAVQLDAGPFFITNVVGASDDLKIGQRVSVMFDHVTDAVTLVKVTPA